VSGDQRRRGAKRRGRGSTPPGGQRRDGTQRLGQRSGRAPGGQRRRGEEPERQAQTGGFWQASGHEASLTDLLGRVLLGLLVGVVGLVLIDGIFAAVGLGTFGHVSGWLAAILPVWLFAEELRTWSGVTLRIGVAIVGALVGVALGSLAGGVTSFLPPLGVGAVGATVATLCYAVVWYYGVRWVAHRVGER
jgi:hypothetical protein